MSVRRSLQFNLIVVTLVVLLVSTAPGRGQNAGKPAPTNGNVQYGPHERNVLDFWRAESEHPAPLVVYIPGYESPHRNFLETFGVKTQDEYLKKVAEVSALSLITADDPPIFMSYGMAPEAPVPSDAQRANGWKVHHVAFGVALKERMDALGIEADLKYPRAKTTYPSNAAFFIAKLAD